MGGQGARVRGLVSAEGSQEVVPPVAAPPDRTSPNELGALKASDGSFNYEVPAGADIGQFKSAVVWCRAFSVLFATAPLAAS